MNIARKENIIGESGKQGKKGAEKERNEMDSSIFSCQLSVSEGETKEAERESERKDRQQALIVLCQRPLRPQTKATRGCQWMDASKVNSHNLQVNTVTQKHTMLVHAKAHRHTHAAQ